MKTKIKTLKGFKPDLSIYELVKQDINVPEGMLYRGKYCGKSQLRKKTNEFGLSPSMRDQFHSNFSEKKPQEGVNSRASRVIHSAVATKKTRN